MTDHPPELRSGSTLRRSSVYGRPGPRPRRARPVRRLPFALAATASLLSAIVLLPLWVAVAFASGAIGLVQSTRARTTEEQERSETVLSFALGCSVGPIVYLLLAAFAAIAG